MGRSFDRGGSRKEREHGKRRAYQQAERDREARQAVLQAKRTQVAEASRKRQPIASAPPIALVETARPPAPDIPVVVIEQKKPGFVAQIFRRLFKKSA